MLHTAQLIKVLIVFYIYLGGSIDMVLPQARWMVDFHGKIRKYNEGFFRGYPNFRKPPSNLVGISLQKMVVELRFFFCGK